MYVWVVSVCEREREIIKLFIPYERLIALCECSVHVSESAHSKFAQGLSVAGNTPPEYLAFTSWDIHRGAS